MAIYNYKMTVDMPELLTGNTLFTTIFKSIDDRGTLVLEELTKWIQKSIKLRAPRASGYMAESISAEPTGKNEMAITGVDYARYQNEGYTPHDVSVWWESRGFPGYSIANWLEGKGTDVNNIGASIKVSKFKQGFIDAGVEAGFENLENIIDDMVIKKIHSDMDKKNRRVKNVYK